MSSVILLVVASWLGVAGAEVPLWSRCDEFPEDVCPITRIELTPCKDIKFCHLFKGKDARIQMEFTPNFNASQLKTSMFWVSENGDVQFSDVFELDGCQYTTCPLEPGKNQIFDFKIRINKKLPNGKFPIKFKFWNAEDNNKACCFKTVVELRK